jgi:hypothetical protein
MRKGRDGPFASLDPIFHNEAVRQREKDDYHRFALAVRPGAKHQPLLAVSPPHCEYLPAPPRGVDWIKKISFASSAHPLRPLR